MIKAQPTEVGNQLADTLNHAAMNSEIQMAKSSEGGNDLSALMQHYRNLIAKERNAKVKKELEERLAQIIADNAGY
jgi:hypothetical protein